MLALAVIALATTPTHAAVPFEITNNKTCVCTTIDGSEPLWFIFDTGNNGPSVIARSCADRLKLDRSADEKVQIGAGSGADVSRSQISRGVKLQALGETLAIAEPQVLTLDHVARIEGRRVDGLLGYDFLSKHVIEIDYARGTMTPHDPEGYEPPRGATVLPLSLDQGWPVVAGTIALKGAKPLPVHLIVDTGMKGMVTMFRPFCERNGLYEVEGSLRDIVTGAGAGGITRGDVVRLDAMTLGPLSFAKPVAGIARDRTGVMGQVDDPDGIMGGEILRRFRVTFDYPHRRMVLEPGDPKAAAAPFEYDMSGLFLGAEDPDYAKIRVLAVNPSTPGSEAGLVAGDEIVSIDGQATPKLSLDSARALLRKPAAHTVEIRRGEGAKSVKLATRRMV